MSRVQSRAPIEVHTFGLTHSVQQFGEFWKRIAPFSKEAERSGRGTIIFSELFPIHEENDEIARLLTASGGTGSAWCVSTISGFFYSTMR